MVGAWLRCVACSTLMFLAYVQAALLNKHSFASPFMAHGESINLCSEVHLLRLGMHEQPREVSKHQTFQAGP
eukprot:17236-Heterococcus_DN1.PRE.2